MTIHRLIQRAAIASTVGLSVAAVSPTVCFGQAQGATQDQVAPTVETGKQPVPCVVNADAVVVRSGGGENYYPTMKLDKGAKVTVVGHKFGWLKVIPPEGSFSYIGKAFVTRTGDGTKGTVNGTEVRVRAGSTLNEMVSIVQAQLNTGTEVEIVGEKNEFFCIKPPPGAYLYINEKYLDPIPQQPGEQVEQVAQKGNTGTGAGTPGDVTPPAPPTDTTTPQPPTDTTAGTGDTTNVEALAGGPTTNPTTGGDALAAAPTTQPLSADAQFDALEVEFTAMSQKRIEEQPITDLIASYQKLIASNELPESMKRIADVRVKMLGIRNEAKIEYEKTMAQQQDAVARRKAADAEREELAEQIKKTDVTVYAAVGTLQTSSLQNGNAMLYRLTDPQTGRTIVYVRTNDASKYGAMIGKFLGVKGEVTTEANLSMKVLVPTDAKEVDPNALYRTIASQIVPPSMLPKTANLGTE
jgi:SH3-like domain-containing protein